MRGYKSWTLKLAGFLALAVMVPTMAEVDHGIDGLGGRSFSTGSGASSLANALSACGVGRLGAGSGVIGGVATGGVAGAAPQAQGGADLGGGIIQASVPPGAVASNANPAASSPTGSTASSAALNPEAILQGKCKTCHTPTSNLPKINATNGLAAVSAGRMPKPPTTITAEEKAALIKAWTEGKLL